MRNQPLDGKGSKMNTDKKYHIHISADKNPLTLNLREIWAYRDLIVLLTKRNFDLIYKQTILGDRKSVV